MAPWRLSRSRRPVPRAGARLHLEALEPRDVPSVAGSGTDPLAAAYGQVPLSFEANQGQTDPQVNFLARGPGYAVFLTPTQAVLRLQEPAAASGSPGTTTTTAGVALDLRLLGGNPAPEVTGLDPQAGTANYFVGNDPRQWHTGVASYGRVAYHDVYPGIDLAYYGNQRQLEYDFVVSPGADPNGIRLAVAGAEDVSVDGAGELVLHTGGGDVVEHAPVLYQDGAGGRQAVAGQFVLVGPDEVGFRVGAYDRTLPLTIDPTLSYSTYLGGSGSDVYGGDIGNDIAVDSAGNAYVTGQASSTDFPTTAGAFQTGLHGGANAFVTKLNATGTALLYSTYLGGSGNGTYGEQGNGIAVDSAGNAYITGYTYSTDFPTTPGTFQTSNHNTFFGNAFATKLNATGTALLYSTYLGGSSYFGDFATAIALDSAGNAYVTGRTTSTDFPTTPAAFQTSIGGPSALNAFVTKLNATATALLYSTYLGGRGNDAGNGIVVDSAGNAYVSGYTTSTNFPTTAGAFQTSYRGSNGNAFITKLNATATALLYSTYLGGSSRDDAFGIALDSAGNAYISGYTQSTSFPTTAGAFQTNYHASFSNAFVTKLNATGTALLYSTYLGGSDADFGRRIAVDSAGNAYVTGHTLSTDFPTTAGAFQTTKHSASYSAFVTKLNGTGMALLYSTYLSGSVNDLGFGIALDSADNAYVTGDTGSPDLPTTAGAFQTSNHGGLYSTNAFVAKFAFAPATHFRVSAPSSATAGAPFSLTVTALDANNHPADYTGTVHFRSSDPQALLPADYTFTAADQGVHTFSVRLATAGGQTVTATDTADATLTGSVGLTVNPAAADHLLVSLPATATAGVPFLATLTVQDAYDNTATGYTGTVQASTNFGEMTQYTFTAADQGTHTFSVGLTRAGSRRVTVIDVADPSINGTGGLVVLPGPLDHFALTAPVSARSGVAFDVTLTAQDAFNNTVDGYRGTVTFSTSDMDAGVVLPADYPFTAADQGVHTFANGVTLQTPGSQTLTVMDLASGAGGQALVQVTSGLDAALGTGGPAGAGGPAPAAGAAAPDGSGAPPVGGPPTASEGAAACPAVPEPARGLAALSSELSPGDDQELVSRNWCQSFFGPDKWSRFMFPFGR